MNYSVFHCKDMRGFIAKLTSEFIIEVMRMIWLRLLFLLMPLLASAAAKQSQSQFHLQLEKRLSRNSFPKTFIQTLLKNYDSTKRDQVLKLNVLGFLLSPNYTNHVSPVGIERCLEFIRINEKTLKLAEKKYGVRPSIIASLLWVESRLGENHGGFHVASVYLDLLLAESPEMTSMLLEDLRKKKPAADGSLMKKTKSRAKIKGRWAIGELWALYQMQKKNPKTISDLKGSYSGAFGFSQFLPSSYVKWAQSASQKRAADLYRAEDAILSVGYYLHKNGFLRSKPPTYKKALFRYNKSTDYGEAILKLAEKVDEQWHRK